MTKEPYLIRQRFVELVLLGTSHFIPNYREESKWEAILTELELARRLWFSTVLRAYIANLRAIFSKEMPILWFYHYHLIPIFTLARCFARISRFFITFAPKFNNFKCMANLNRLKVVLVEQQKTGKWLAEQLGKSTCTVSKWCNNVSQPDLKTLNDIANVLKVDVKNLLVSNKL